MYFIKLHNIQKKKPSDTQVYNGIINFNYN